MLKKPFALSVVLLGSLGMSAVQGQGLGGLINKAKEKVSQTNSSPATKGVALDHSGHPQHITPPETSTPARERALADAIMADPKPGTNEDGDGRDYKKVKQEYHFSPAYTADDSFFSNLGSKGYANYYISWIDKVSDEFYDTATSNYGQAVQEAMAKIKTVHLTSLPSTESQNPDDAQQGWKFTFDKATGTLTIFFGEARRAWVNDHVLAKWAAKNIS